MDPGARRADPPSATDAALVLRYWQALLRYEEALSSTPRARRPSEGERGAPNLAAPVAGQDYMKLPFTGVARFLLSQHGRVRQALNDERLAFFEHWLASKYRTPEDDERTAHLALFPVIHSAREELLGVLRFPVELEWWAGERRFEIPEPAARRGASLPPLPDQIEIRELATTPDEALPFFVDIKLLRDLLRVDTEALDQFGARLRQKPAPNGPTLVSALCDLLWASIHGDESAPPAFDAPREPDAAAAAWLSRLHGLLAERLAQLESRARVYPLALIVASDRSRTTWHVQRDLEEALARVESDEGRLPSPLDAYLSGRSGTAGAQVCLGRWPRAPLTESQRWALERALGSSFTAIQGPPGTGKTTLILNLVAHQLIEKVRALAETSVMGDDFVLVTSTNNRAVDNVVEGLATEAWSDVPLCLRVGHRALIEKTTVRVLERAHAWLTRQPESVPASELGSARTAFSAALERVKVHTRAQRAVYEREARQATLRADRAELEREAAPQARTAAEQTVVERLTQLLPSPADVTSSVLGPHAPWRSAPQAASFAVSALLRGLDKISEQCEEGGPLVLRRVATMFGRLRTEQLGAACEAIGAQLPCALPPGGDASLEDWEDALAAFLGPLGSLARALEQLAAHHAAQERLRNLELELGTASRDEPAKGGHSSPETAAASEADGSEAFTLLFERALELRGAWLRQHRAPLLKSLESAISHCRNVRSLRGVLDSSKPVGSWLRQLFPSIGCTLLSLGNTLGTERPSCQRVVIDEAGQCPSAYAVSAFLRARSALSIGDVHQLPPVLGLSRDDEQRILRSAGLELRSERLAPYRMFEECGHSAQSLAERAVPDRPTLRDHFRCQPAIIALSEAWCGYGMTVRTPPRSRAALAPRLSAATLFQDCPGTQERCAGSWINTLEIEQVLGWVGYLQSSGIELSEIGVITPFRSQAEALARRLAQTGIFVSRGFDEDDAEEQTDLFGTRRAHDAGVALGTVHRFQGGERSIIVFSSALTRTASLRFVDERVNLLNVAVSRAKDHLIVIGHEQTLRAGQHTRLLVSGAARSLGF
jgi:hypothetical protein